DRGAVVDAHPDDGLPGGYAKSRQGMRGPRRQAIELAVGRETAREVEQHPIGVRRHRAVERSDDGVLFADGPGVRSSHAIHRTFLWARGAERFDSIGPSCANSDIRTKFYLSYKSRKSGKTLDHPSTHQ